jgi:hypothetical protein
VNQGCPVGVQSSCFFPFYFSPAASVTGTINLEFLTFETDKEVLSTSLRHIAADVAVDHDDDDRICGFSPSNETHCECDEGVQGPSGSIPTFPLCLVSSNLP